MSLFFCSRGVFPSTSRLSVARSRKAQSDGLVDGFTVTDNMVIISQQLPASFQLRSLHVVEEKSSNLFFRELESRRKDGGF